MLGRGPEDIFICIKQFSWPLNFPFEIFNDPPFYSCDFSWPHSPCKVRQVRTWASPKKDIFLFRDYWSSWRAFKFGILLNIIVSEWNAGTVKACWICGFLRNILSCLFIYFLVVWSEFLMQIILMPALSVADQFKSHSYSEIILESAIVFPMLQS